MAKHAAGGRTVRRPRWLIRRGRLPWRRIAWTAGVLGVAVALGFSGPRGAYPAERPRLLSGAAWLVSSQVGQLSLLDGSTVEVAAQIPVAAPGDQLDVAQQGSVAYTVDRTTGSISRTDAVTFLPSPAVRPFPDARAGLQVFPGTGVVYVLDAQRGIVTSVDPKTLVSQHPPTSLAARVSPQAVSNDQAGRLWVLDQEGGELVRLADGTRWSHRVGGTGGLLTLADGAPVVVDQQRRTATRIDPVSGGAGRPTALDLRVDDRVQVGGAAHGPRLYVVASRGVLTMCDLAAGRCDTSVPIGTPDSDFGSPVETGGRVFVPDRATGRVWIVDIDSGQVVAQPPVLPPATSFQLLTRDGIVFFNDPNSQHAGVIRLDGGVVKRDKYDPANPSHGLHNPAGGAGDRSGTSPPPPTPDQPRPSGSVPPPPAVPQPLPPPGQPTPPGQPPPAPSPSPSTRPPTPTPPLPTPTTPGPPSVRIALNPGAPYVVGQQVTLAARNGTGGPAPTGASWQFGDGGTGSGVSLTHQWGAAGTYQVSVTATFPGGQTAQASVSLTVAVKPTLTVEGNLGGVVTGDGGISCPGTCTATYMPGAKVHLTVKPRDDTSFNGWGGACASAGRRTTCTVTMNGDQDVSMSFVAKPTLTVEANTQAAGVSITSSVGGISCPGVCSARIDLGQKVTLTVHDIGGLPFFQWQGDCASAGSSKTCTLTMDTDKSVTATWQS